MKLWGRHSVGLKLSGILAAVILLALCPLAYVVGISVSNFGLYSANVNEEQIRQQAIHYLSRLSREQGYKYEEYFNRIQSTVSLLATQASALYRMFEKSSGDELPRISFEFKEKNSMFLSPPEEPVLTIYWGDKHISPEVLREAGTLSLLDPLMQRAKAVLPDTLAIHMITTSGIGRYYTLHEKSRKIARNLPKTSVFDLRDGAPLTIFTKEKRDRTRPQWTPLYRDDVIDGLMLTAAGAMLDGNGRIMGEVGVDLPLQTLVDDILLDSDIAAMNGGQILFSFLVDASGRLIAFPDKYLKKFGFDFDIGSFKHSDDVLRFSLQQSREPGIVRISSQLLSADNTVQQIEIGGEKYLIATQGLDTLGWKFSLVTRDSDMISSVHRTEKALEGTLFKLRKEFLVNSAITVCLALLIVLLAIRHFVGPLKRLSEVAQKVGEGDLTVRPELNRVDEIGALGKAMQKMIHKLSLAEKLRTDYSRLLEDEIRMRTRDLEEKNRQLEQVVGELNEESRARRSATEALIESERQLRGIMGSSLAGLCIVQDGRFKYVNSAMEELFGYTREQLVDTITPDEIIVEEFRDVVRKRLNRRKMGEYIRPGKPLHIQCIREDNQIIDVLVAGAGIHWEGKPAMVGTIVDISLLKRVEEKLRVNERRLEASLEEKNVLLREVYHRTKNNMLVIISLLELQKAASGDERVIAVFTEMENRIRAMALVHENLYQTSNLSDLRLGGYLEKLIRGLVSSMTVENQISVTTEFEPVTISFDQAVPLGLVVNELVTNSLKHGFPGGRRGNISFSIHRDGNNVELVLRDDGIGIPVTIDVRRSRSFGLQIASSMIEKQLGGSFEVERKDGTIFYIRFRTRYFSVDRSEEYAENSDC